jgi:hypothetical protein
VPEEPFRTCRPGDHRWWQDNWRRAEDALNRPARHPGVDWRSAGRDLPPTRICHAPRLEALYLVQRIRDEAHRFAITFHRQVRAKSSIQSALDTIAGVGPKRKKALLKKFGSVKAIREASVEDVASTVGFTRALAEKVKESV